MTSKAAAKREPGLGTARWAALGFYALTCLTFLVTFGFEAAAVSRMPGFAIQLGDATFQIEDSLGALAAHLDWRATTVLFLGSLILGVALALWNVWRACAEDRQVGGLLILTGGAAGACAYLFATLSTHPTSLIEQVLDLMELEDLDFARLHISGLVMLVKRGGEVLAGVVGMGIAATVVLPRHLDAETLADRVSRLRQMLMMSAVMLVLSVFMTSAVYHWVFAMFTSTGDQPIEPDALTALASSATRLAGSMYSLVLGVMYVPCALHLQRTSLRIARKTVEDDEQADLGGWMERHGLKLEWRGQLGRLLVILAPFLSSVLPQLNSLWQ